MRAWMVRLFCRPPEVEGWHLIDADGGRWLLPLGAWKTALRSAAVAAALATAGCRAAHSTKCHWPDAPPPAVGDGPY